MAAARGPKYKSLVDEAMASPRLEISPSADPCLSMSFGDEWKEAIATMATDDASSVDNIDLDISSSSSSSTASSTASTCTVSSKATYSTGLTIATHGEPIAFEEKDKVDVLVDKEEDNETDPLLDRALAAAIAKAYTPSAPSSLRNICTHSLVVRCRSDEKLCHHCSKKHAFCWVYECTSCRYLSCHNCRPKFIERAWGSLMGMVSEVVTPVKTATAVLPVEIKNGSGVVLTVVERKREVK